MPGQMPRMTPPVANAPSSASQPDDPKKSVWTEHKAGDRVYFYNTQTKQSVWEKPDQLKTPAELLLGKCPWKEYKSDTGKVYFHNVETKESRWTVPKELEELKKKIAEKDGPAKSEGPTPGKTPSAIELAMAATLAAIQVPEPEAEKERYRSPVFLDDHSVSHVKVAPPHSKILVFADKKEAIDSFKEYLKQKCVPSDATWEKALRIIQNDIQYQSYNKLNEKKQAFNSYKVHRAKEEKEEARLKAKKAKEDLEQFLLNNKRMTSTIKYYACHDLFHHYDSWQNVPEVERREIYEDVVFTLQKREKEENKQMRKKNMKSLSDILDNMDNISFKTTWSEAQQMLIDNPTFSEDTELLSMDKEDALIVFAEHIKQLEEEEEEDRDKEKKRLKRQQRKVRDNYSTLLDGLHDQGKLTSMSLWVELHPIISADPRYTQLLGQPGSNPLDLFKFYVADLKSRFHDEKKIIREILKEKDFDVQVKTTFMEFATIVCDDARSATLDAGNVKLTYNALMEKAEGRERERLKEESRRTRRLESDYRALLREHHMDGETRWEEFREKVAEDPAFVAVTVEADRERLFKEYQEQVEETCGHHHTKNKKKYKKKEKRRSRSRSAESSGSETRHRRSASEDEEHKHKPRRKKSKKRRHRSRSESGGGSSDEERTKSPTSKRASRKKKNRQSKERISSRGSAEEGELSEDELEKKRALLMQELENAM